MHYAEVASKFLLPPRLRIDSAPQVAHLLLSDSTDASPPYLRRWQLLRRSRRRVRAARQARRVLALREELVARAVLSAWHERMTMRRLVRSMREEVEDR